MCCATRASLAFCTVQREHRWLEQIWRTVQPLSAGIEAARQPITTGVSDNVGALRGRVTRILFRTVTGCSPPRYLILTTVLFRCDHATTGADVTRYPPWRYSQPTRPLLNTWSKHPSPLDNTYASVRVWCGAYTRSVAALIAPESEFPKCHLVRKFSTPLQYLRHPCNLSNNFFGTETFWRRSD